MLLHEFLECVVSPELFGQILIKRCRFALTKMLEYIFNRRAIP